MYVYMYIYMYINIYIYIYIYICVVAILSKKYLRLSDCGVINTMYCGLFGGN